MGIPPDNPVTSESDSNACGQSHKGRTWFPILLGVLCGMIALSVLAKHEPAVFWHFTAWMLNEAPPVKLIEPRSVHFTLFMLTLAATGGFIGVAFSRWRKGIAFLFLLAILSVITLFATLGESLESVWH
jgi:hypothetical protein